MKMDEYRCFSCDGPSEKAKGICQYCKDQARSMMQGMTKLTNEQKRGVKGEIK